MHERYIEIDSSYNIIYNRIRGVCTYSCTTPSKMLVSPTFIEFTIDPEFDGWQKRSGIRFRIRPVEKAILLHASSKDCGTMDDHDV